MNLWQEAANLATSGTAKQTLLSGAGVAGGWLLNWATGWWKSRDRYHAHITWKMVDTMYGPEETPVIILRSVHNVPIDVTNLRVRNGFRLKTEAWPFDSPDPDYPNLPRSIEPLQSTMFLLNEKALADAANRSRWLNWLWVPRVYIGVQTMGRGERLFAAEGGLQWSDRRRRYRR